MPFKGVLLCRNTLGRYLSSEEDKSCFTPNMLLFLRSVRHRPLLNALGSGLKSDRRKRDDLCSLEINPRPQLALFLRDGSFLLGKRNAVR